MSTDGKAQKINVGFLGGQVLGARVTAAELSKLRAALDAGGWHDLESEDGTVTLDLSKVVYVLADGDAKRLGFGS